MAMIAVAGFGAWAGAGTTGVTAGLIAAATAAAAIGAAYIDSRYIYPKLFGKDEPQNPSVLGLDAMTGEDGSPGHRAWGRSALVGGHCIFFENVETITNRASNKKTGAGTIFTKRTATVGLGWCHNLIQGVESIYADQKVFWRRDPNNVVWSDYRCTITTASAGTRLVITPTVSDAQDIGPVIFDTSYVVRLSNTSSGLVGYWRVVASYGIGDATYPYGRLELTSLEGQTPAAGDPGTPAVPMEIHRIDAAIIDDLAQWSTAANFRMTVRDLNSPNTSPGVGLVASRSRYCRPLDQTLRVGMVLRLSGFTALSGSVNGRWRIRAIGERSLADPNAVIAYFDPLDGQVWSAPITPGTEALPAVAILQGDEGFLEPSEGQEIVHYLGTEDQGADPDIEAIFGSGNAHGYRGLGRSTIRNYNLSNVGDRVAQHAAVVRVNSRHTTHDVFRDVMLEHYDDDSSFDLDDLEPNVVIGYSRRGLQRGTTTLQPVAIAYGIESQDIGGKWRLFKGSAADLHQIEENELGAFRGDRPVQRFRHQRVQDRDLPRRLSLFYRDPLNDFSRTEKLTRAASPTDQSGEDVAVDVDPLVLFPWDAQNAVNRLFVQSLIGRDQGVVTLGPSRCDILPNDRLTYTALNWNTENVTLVGGAIDHTTQIAGIEEGSVDIEVDFETAGGCRLVDDGAGALVGFPDTITVTTNTVDYAAGTIEFACDDTILSGRLRYEFPNGWRMRVQAQTCYRNRIFEQQLVAVAERFPVVGSSVQRNDPAYQLSVRPATLRTHVLDIAGVLEPFVWHPGVFFAAAPLPGSDWRGAGVYRSTDGISYTLMDYIQTPTTMGVASDHLATADVGVEDWSQSLTVALDYGSLSSATLDEISSGSGTNWALYGDEILAFRSATLNQDGTYTLTGFVRGLRDTADAIGGHADGERFVLLTTLGVAELSGVFHEFAMPTEVGRQVYVKVVPAGGDLDDYDATTVVWHAENVRPFAPTSVVQGDLATYGYSVAISAYDADAWLTSDVVIRWFRRTRSVSPIFGAGAASPLLEAAERYEVRVLRNGGLVRTELVGGLNTGSPMVHRTFRYTLAQQTADGWLSGETARFEVRQIGAGGTGGLSRAAAIEWPIP